MFVENWMTPDPLTVLPTMTISAAALFMGRHKFRHLLVAEAAAKGKKLAGLLSKYDLARAFPNHLNPFSLEVADDTVPQPISTIMVRNVVTVEPYCAIEEAARIFRTRRINALPVIRAGILVGILTESDVFDAMLNMTGADDHAIRLVVESDDVGKTLNLISQLAEQCRLGIIDAISFRNHKLENKIFSAFHFSTRPTEQFLQQLRTRGIRIVQLG
ncbi:MAG: CBS domain-containing protein [Candidatus Binatia bacterium]